MFYITGGEYNDEGSKNCYSFKIAQKILGYVSELNVPRRYHSMLNLNNRFICVIGGWGLNDVEFYDTSIGKEWREFHKMNYCRSDASCLFFNKKWIYVIGGWSYSLKHSLGSIERYEFFENNNIIKFHGSWENISIKSNLSYCLSKYNMGIIVSEDKKYSESYILFGGYIDREKDTFFSLKSNEQDKQLMPSSTTKTCDSKDITSSYLNVNLNKVSSKSINNCNKNNDNINNVSSKFFSSSSNYSREIINFTIDKKTNQIRFSDTYLLKEDLDMSFWYEKNLQIMRREDGTYIAVGFNCNNDIILYDYLDEELRFKLYKNNIQNNKLKLDLDTFN